MTFFCYLSEFSDNITLGIIKTKKLPPPGEATQNTINIPYLDKFWNLHVFTPVLFHN